MEVRESVRAAALEAWLRLRGRGLRSRLQRPDRSMRPLIVLAIVSIAALVGSIAYLSHQYSAEREDAQRWVRHSYAVIETLQDQLSALTEAEAANRGFLLTGRDVYVRTYRERTQAAFAHLAKFHQLIASSPKPVALNSNLYELVVSKYESMEWYIEAGKQAGGKERIALVRSKIDDEIMEKTRLETERLMEKQHQILLEQENLATESERRSILIAALSCMVALLGLGLAFLAFVVETINRQRRARWLLMERQSAKLESRSKSALLAYTSHELRTPLNAIVGFSEMLLEEYVGNLTAKQKDYVESIRDSGQHLSALLTDILDLSQLEAGKIELNVQPVDLADIIPACLELVTVRARSSGVALRSEIIPATPLLEADPLRVKQILINLITNSVKFTPPGGTVVVSAGKTRAGGVALSVRDTGIGIPRGEIAGILRPYHRVKNPMTRTREGIGLGLPLTKRLVEMHGGRILIESEEGAGTEVTVLFPRRRVWLEAVPEPRVA
jgi:signal transduction histidine kinase